MKNIKYLMLLIMATGISYIAAAQTKQEKKKAKQAVVSSMVTDQEYTFTAQYANPQRGGHRFLTSDYDLRVKKDSIIAYLPYFGQAYFDVPYNSDEAGIKFTSTKFTYKISQKKNKGGWDVIIKTQDVKNVSRIILFISPDGYASLQFLLVNRDAITFDGFLKDKKGN